MTPSFAALVDATCGALDRMPVRITGAWQPRTDHGDWTRHEWHGAAWAAAPMVALLCVRTGDLVEWHKSQRSMTRAPSQATVSEDAPAAPSTATPIPAPAGHELPIELAIHTTPSWQRAGFHLHVQRAYASIAADMEAPAAGAPVLDIAAGCTTTTGVVFDLACVPGTTPPVVLSLLFIADAQVKMGRNHLWRVRRTLAPALDEPLRTLLTRGRRGTLALDGLRT